MAFWPRYMDTRVQPTIAVASFSTLFSAMAAFDAPDQSGNYFQTE
jgi:hypothetical protein